MWEMIPGLGRSLGRGPGNPLQLSYLENPMDRGAWQAMVHGVADSNGAAKQKTQMMSALNLDKVCWSALVIKRLQ